ALVLQRDGKAVVVGGIDCTSGHCACAAVALRYARNGSLDSSFGTSGKVDVGFEPCSVATAVALAPHGKIIVGGDSHAFALARLNRDGSLDRHFGHRGVATTAPGGLIRGIA